MFLIRLVCFIVLGTLRVLFIVAIGFIIAVNTSNAIAVTIENPDQIKLLALKTLNDIVLQIEAKRPLTVLTN